MSSSQAASTPSKRKSSSSDIGTRRTPKTPRITGPVIPPAWTKSTLSELTAIRGMINPDDIAHTGDPDVIRRLENAIRNLSNDIPSPARKGRGKVPVKEENPERKVWGKREDCPLLEKLPGIFLDRCFGADQGYTLRDWLSLAGTSRFFRDRLDDNVFKDLHAWGSCRAEKSIHTWTKYKPRKLRPSYHIFTRTFVAPQRTLPATPTVDRPSIEPEASYLPPGPRSSWTREQYIKYKADKKAHYNTEQAKRDETSEIKLAKRLKIRKSRIINSPLDPIEAHSMVLGQKLKVKSKPKPWEKEIGKGVWETPDTDGEDELGPKMRTLPLDWCIKPVVCDYWPSEWRKKVVIEVNDMWMNKTEAAKRFCITPDILMSLKHALVKNTHDKAGKQDIKMFLLYAVEALAIRHHGGYAAHIQKINARNAKIRAAKIVPRPTMQSLPAPSRVSGDSRIKPDGSSWDQDGLQGRDYYRSPDKPESSISYNSEEDDSNDMSNFYDGEPFYNYDFAPRRRRFE